MDHAAAQLLGVRPDHLGVVAGAVIKSARSKSLIVSFHKIIISIEKILTHSGQHHGCQSQAWSPPRTYLGNICTLNLGLGSLQYVGDCIIMFYQLTAAAVVPACI